jgi:hypothetical protein
VPRVPDGLTIIPFSEENSRTRRHREGTYRIMVKLSG